MPLESSSAPQASASASRFGSRAVSPAARSTASIDEKKTMSPLTCSRAAQLPCTASGHQGGKLWLLPARRPQGGRGSGAGQEKARQQGGKRMQAVEDQPAAHVSEHGSSDETGKKARPGIVAEAQGALGLCL